MIGVPSETAASGMPRYQSHKRVWALQIEAIEPVMDAPDDPMAEQRPIQYKVQPRDKGYAAFVVGAEVFSRYVPVPGDYYVVYDDGYKSVSPQKAFEEGYTRVGETG